MSRAISEPGGGNVYSVGEKRIHSVDHYSERKHSEVALPLDRLTPFRKKVLEAMQKVSFGTVTSYSELASEAGHPGAARAVGTACHFNPFPLFIPCHRVIAASGKIGGFALDINIKKMLLDFEAK